MPPPPSFRKWSQVFCGTHSGLSFEGTLLWPSCSVGYEKDVLSPCLFCVLSHTPRTHPPHVRHDSGSSEASRAPVQVTYIGLHGALPSPARQAMRCRHGFTQRLRRPTGSIGWAVRYGQGYTQGFLGASSHGCLSGRLSPLLPPICSFGAEAALAGYSRADRDRVGFPWHQGDLFHLECVSYCTKTRNCLTGGGVGVREGMRRCWPRGAQSHTGR